MSRLAVVLVVGMVMGAAGLVTSGRPLAAAGGSVDVLWPRDGLKTDQNEMWLQVELPDRPDTLHTEFFLRRPEGESFTVAVLPDTQHYTDDPANWPLFAAQTRWIVDTRDELNTVFTVHVGDLVQNRSEVEQEWIVADEAFDILDAAGMPVAVVPGNHDTRLSGRSPLFDRFFPPARWSGEPWYGGYLGDDPADPVNRQSRNSFQYLTVGANEFLFLNLDWTVPGPSLAWGQRVIDEHPDHKVIINTHVFLDADGVLQSTVFSDRPFGRSALEIYNKLVEPNCSVIMVLAGHYSGEAHRREINRCGDPVHLVTADYQSRANGGDGWLRYMVFDPATDSVEVVTYSPVLDRFEVDADSAFSLDVALDTAGTTTFTSIGTRTTTGRTRTGARASDLRPGGYEWYAVVSDSTGAEIARSPTATFVVEGQPEVDTPPTVDGLRYVPGTSTTPPSIVADLADDRRVSQVLAVIADNQRGTFWQGGDRWGARTVVDVTPPDAGTEARLEIPLLGALDGGHRIKLWVYDNRSQEVIRRLQFTVDGATGAGVDVTPPSSIIGSPAHRVTVPAPFTISGTATDDRRVDDVLVVVKDERNALFWNGSAWQSRWTQISAALDAPGSATTGWSVNLPGPVPATKLYISSRAVDGSGKTQDPPTWITVWTP